MSRRRFLVLHAAGLTLPVPRFALAQSLPSIKVAGVYTVPLEQQWAGRLHQALQAAEAAREIDYRPTHSVGHAAYERVLREQAGAGAQLIVGEAFSVEAAARKVARSFPGTMFLMGSSSAPQAPNFSVFDNYIHEPAYLAGMLAGGMTRSHRLGAVGGFPIPEVVRLVNAFMAGAREVNPRGEFGVRFINSWFDPARARDAALALIDQGVDVVYAERLGASEAARERKVLAIGNVVDTQAQFPDTVLASVLWHAEPVIGRAIRLVREGRFQAEDYGVYAHMQHGGAALSPLGSFEKRVPAELAARVRARQADILAGRFVVRIDESQPLSNLR